MQLRNGRRLSFAETYLNLKTIPFWLIHAVAIGGVVALGWSWAGLALALALYVPRMFFVTGAYHRYFSHRSYRTSRWFQFVLACGAASTAQKGVMWWAANHRHHHRASDQPSDKHSPRDGFWWSHLGWILSYDNEKTDTQAVKDLAKYPELVWLDKYHLVPAIAVAFATFFIGGWYAVIWGFFVSTVLCWHGTFTINSLAHVIGSRRYETTDDSRNHFGLALITLGEGWHNNHHHRPGVARQGVVWWEIDITYYILRGLAALGLVWDLRAAPKAKVAPTAETTPTPVPILPAPVSSPENAPLA